MQIFEIGFMISTKNSEVISLTLRSQLPDDAYLRVTGKLVTYCDNQLYIFEACLRCHLHLKEIPQTRG